LIYSLAAIAGLFIVVFVAQREYSYQRDALALEVSTQVAAQPRLPLTLYFRDEQRIQASLDEFLGLSPAVRHALLRDSLGDVIARRTRPWADMASLPDFRESRRSSSATERSLVSYRSPQLPPDLASMGWLLRGETVTSVIVPVVSVVNPTRHDLSPADFGTALAQGDTGRSLFVSGYVEVGLSSLTLWQQTLPALSGSAAFGLGFLIVCVFIARLTTKRITAPLGELDRVAEDIASGQQTRMLKLQGSGEIRDIAAVLNSIISGLNTEKRRMHTDRKLLSLKVDERTAQLSAREQELTRAVQQVSDTRERLRHLAYFDSLTALPNRRLFTEQLSLLLRLAARSEQMVALLLLDLDNFKRINDSLGHRNGDLLLKEVSDRLAGCIRESDVIHRNSENEASRIDLSRMGGDEFTVVLNQLDDLSGAEIVAARLTRALSQPYLLNGEEVIITCSIGIAAAPAHGSDVESLLRAAGTAMLSAKKEGRNRFLVFDERMEGSNLERLRLETELRKAVSRNQLFLEHQPQVDTRTGTVVGTETLVRWEHPEFGVVPPFKFIPLAEELGLIDEIGEWVLRQACRDFTTLRDAGHALTRVAVNVSALQFRESLVDLVDSILRDTGLEASALKLELTEGVMIDNQDSALRVFNALRDLGVQLSIDDFGTGYSSLGYLTRLPLSELKIDRSFVRGLTEGEKGAELVRGIIAMAGNLHLNLVVEGVENLEQLDFFNEQGVHVVQGYLFSPPVRPDVLTGMLAEGHFSGRGEAQDDGLVMEQA
jgi:diguanylate cyclase (GGDEF)-like protein